MRKLGLITILLMLGFLFFSCAEKAEDPAQVAAEVTYDHWLYARTSLNGAGGAVPMGTLLHEYGQNELGDGIVMQSTFTVPSFVEDLPGFVNALGQHALEEMQFLPDFLPGLFEQEYIERDI